MRRLVIPIIQEGEAMQLLKTNKIWLFGHAEQSEDGTWKCRKTGVPIVRSVVERSIWIKSFIGSYGGVREIGHLHCPKCQPNPKLPSQGASIDEDELVGPF